MLCCCDSTGALTDEAILAWADEQRERIAHHPKTSDALQVERRKLFQDEKVQEFIEWIEGEEEDDEEEDDEEVESNGEDADDSDEE